MRGFRSTLFAGLVVGGFVLLGPGTSAANLFVQEIKNTSDLTTANDLTLQFVNVPGAVAVTDTAGKNPKFPSSQNGINVVYNPGALPANVGPGLSVQVRFSGGNGTRINKAQSFFTNDNVQIVGALASVGLPPDLIFSGGEAFARLTNPESFAVVYSGITLYRDNDAANYTLDGFDTPTGVLVTGLPESITLGPGDFMDLSFGPVSAGSYQLASAFAAPESDPTDTDRVAAAAVPEPHAIFLLGAGCLALSLRLRRRRAG